MAEEIRVLHSYKFEPALELNSWAAPSVEAHHCSSKTIWGRYVMLQYDSLTITTSTVLTQEEITEEGV